MTSPVYVKNDIISKNDLEYILALPEVVDAKTSIDKKTSGSVYFTSQLTSEIKKSIGDSFGIDLTSIESVPLRWIKGDMPSHIDSGKESFNKTYLIYLTDSVGQIIIDGISYPITQGAAYAFSEGLSHETTGTDSEPRLLLGPMSEQGFAVGGPINYYIRQNESVQEYSYNLEEWYEISWPFNTYAITVEFVTDISLNNTNNYFICNNSNMIFGSASLKEDGTRPKIYIDGVSDYPGFIRNGTESEDGYSNINIYNLEIKAINGSTLAEGQGWLCQSHFGKAVSGNYIINCSSDGPISATSGGIVGFQSGEGTEGDVLLSIIGCSSSGSIAMNGGGIIGAEAAINGGTVVCQSCWSTGSIGINAGGIAGASAGLSSGNVTITNCYSEGAISGASAGGIIGESAEGNCIINNCYSRGIISGADSGGIVGEFATDTTITNCYSTGNINGSGGAGGIAGSGSSSITIQHCYTSGSSTGLVGYIEGDSSTVSITNYSEAANSSSGWNSTNANTVLEGLPAPVVGTIWVATVLGEPYELRNMGYSPYTTTIITGNSFTSSYPFLQVGGEVEKDMDNEDYTDEFDPNDYQSEFFPDMADFVDANIIEGDKDESDRLNASYWDDLGDDVFDEWGYFYLYDVVSGKYYFPLLSPQNQADDVITTQTCAAFGRTFTIKHGWSAQGIFQFDISVADSLPFRFGAYGNMGSDGSEYTEDLTSSYTITGSDRTLYYRLDKEDGANDEILYSYFIPKNVTENNSKQYNVYYNDDDNMSMVTNELTTGVTVYFAKKNDVKDWVINQLKIAAGESGSGITVTNGGSTAPAIISGKTYTILQKEGGDAASYASITINSITGAISTTSDTLPGTYTLYIRNTGSYNISAYTLTVNVSNDSPETILSCCQRPLILNTNNYTINNVIISGNTILYGVRRGVMSYSDLIKKQIALNSRR